MNEVYSIYSMSPGVINMYITETGRMLSDAVVTWSPLLHAV